MTIRCILLLFIIFTKTNGFLSSEDNSLSEEEAEFKHCVCVPFWQCKEDLNLVDGDGKSSKQKGVDSQCTGYFDVCCKLQCGIRESLDFSEFNKRILGDKNSADFGEFPWMLGILKGQTYKCGASLIHPKVALTAAHCVTSPGNYKVRAGEWHWELKNEPLPHQDRDVETIIRHPKFHPGSLVNDIALLIVEQPFKLTKNVGIICVPRKLQVDLSKCVASGWGKNSFRKGTYQPVLKKVDLPIVARDKCLSFLRDTILSPFFTLHESFICAGGEPNKDTCKGDGGSPLMCPVIGQEGRYEQVGIVSWGMRCGLTYAPGIYVNVIIFSDWIDTQMSRHDLDSDIYRYN